MSGHFTSCIIVRRNLEGIGNMQRKSSFEDFEELMNKASETEKTREELEFNPETARRQPEPKIPAVGSEMFDEGEDDAEARYRRREERLRKKAEKRRRSKHWGGRILAITQLILSIISGCAASEILCDNQHCLRSSGSDMLWASVWPENPLDRKSDFDSDVSGADSWKRLCD